MANRDRNLVRFDEWATAKLATISDPAQHRVIEQFITWHHKRRFRALSEQGQLSQGQILSGRQQLGHRVKVKTAWGIGPVRGRDSFIVTAYNAGRGPIQIRSYGIG